MDEPNSTPEPEVTPTAEPEQQPTNTPKPTPEPTPEPDTPKAPESPDEYKVELDGFDFEAFKADEFNVQFLQEAHQAGFTNEQLSVALKAHEQYTAVAVDALKEEWGGDFEKNINLAKQAFAAAGMETNQIDSPTAALRLAAFVGSKLGEDMPPLNVHQNGTESIAELMASEAYMNERHPDHKRVYAQVSSYYAKMNPEG